MKKSRQAFRTISEVADWLDTPAHVLRFWESKFPQVKPLKRAGGRRYYRPKDMLLLGGIKQILHHDKTTIKAAQALLRAKGVKHVASLSPPLFDGADDGAATENEPAVAEIQQKADQAETEAPAPEKAEQQQALDLDGGAAPEPAKTVDRPAATTKTKAPAKPAPKSAAALILLRDLNISSSEELTKNDDRVSAIEPLFFELKMLRNRMRRRVS